MDIPAQCPCCGAFNIQPDAQTSALLAVCEVLTLKALESMGKRIVRTERSRFRALGTRPYYVAHTLWQPDDETVTKALKGAWDVVPALLDVHGCCGVTSRQVTEMLDCYVHDLCVTGTEHETSELAYRFSSRLGLSITYSQRWETADA